MALGDLLKSFILAQLPGIVKANGEANGGHSHLHMSVDVVRWSADVLPYNGHGEDLYRKRISVRYGGPRISSLTKVIFSHSCHDWKNTMAARVFSKRRIIISDFHVWKAGLVRVVGMIFRDQRWLGKKVNVEKCEEGL